MDASSLEYVVHGLTIAGIAFGAAAAGVKCAASHFAEDHMEQQERQIDHGEDNRSTRIVRKAMAPVLSDLVERIDRFEGRITMRVESLGDAIRDLALKGHYERDDRDS